VLLRDALARWRSGAAGLANLDAALRRMEVAAKTRDGVQSLQADLDFHRAICEAAGNEIAATLWSAIARHVLIIFNHDDYRDNDLNAVVRHHRAFRDQIGDWIAAPAGDTDLKAALETHLTQVSRAKRKAAA
jgi:DNA-binding FadR family transcriptional regulator